MEHTDQAKKMIDGQMMQQQHYMKMGAAESPGKGHDENVPPSARSGIAPINTKVGAAATGAAISKLDLDKRASELPGR